MRKSTWKMLIKQNIKEGIQNQLVEEMGDKI